MINLIVEEKIKLLELAIQIAIERSTAFDQEGIYKELIAIIDEKE